VRVHSGGWPIGNSYGAGSGEIVFTHLSCNGSETNIAYCRQMHGYEYSWSSYCSHDDDVSISCNTSLNGA